MKTTYTCLIKMRCNALWAAEFWYLQAKAYDTIGAMEKSIRYVKVLNRIEAAMWNFPSTNEFRRVEG